MRWSCSESSSKGSIPPFLSFLPRVKRAGSWPNSLLLIGTVLLYGVLLFATRQTLIVSFRKVEFDLRNEIVEKLMRLPQRFYSEKSNGEIYVRATEDVAR